MTFIPWPWKNEDEAKTTPLSKAELQAAEEALYNAAKADAEAASIKQPKVQNLGPVFGTIEPDAAAGSYIRAEITGNTTIEKIKNWPAGVQEVNLELSQDNTGGHTITVNNAT